MTDYLQHLALAAGLRKGNCYTMDAWEDQPQLDGDDVVLSLRWDIDQCRWQAWVGTEAEPTNLHTSPLYDTPQEALAWLKAQSDAYEHIPCEVCGDEGVLSGFTDEWSHTSGAGHYTRDWSDFCECRVGRQKRDEADCHEP